MTPGPSLLVAKALGQCAAHVSRDHNDNEDESMTIKIKEKHHYDN